MISKINIELYKPSNYPSSGRHILAHTQDDLIVVYQGYKESIARYATSYQKFGGDFSFNRMSWIKPNFLWMMFRSGWATKTDQERILAIWIRKQFFDNILREAVFSSYGHTQYKTVEDWKRELDSKQVRLQWDPDHDPYGFPLERRALQLGLKGSMLKRFATEEIVSIVDVTRFVREQFETVFMADLKNLLVPVERIYKPISLETTSRIGLD